MTRKQHGSALTMALLLVALVSSSIAFTSVQPQPSTATRRTNALMKPEPATALRFSSNDNDNNFKEDWNRLTEAAGSIVRNVGGKVWNSLKSGASKLKKLATSGLDSVKSAFQPVDTTKVDDDDVFETVPDDITIMDTQDENLFRGLFGDEGIFSSDEASMDAVIDQAASVLKDNDLATSLLGPSLRYGRPFSESMETTTVNGRTTNTLETSLEVWGSYGQGIAYVTAMDGTLTGLDLQVNGRLHRVDVTPLKTQGPWKHRSKTEQQWGPAQETPPMIEEEEEALEVEVIGVRRPVYHGPGGVMDAEILDKTFRP